MPGSYWNPLTNTHEIMFYQLSGHVLVESSHKVSHHILLFSSQVLPAWVQSDIWSWRRTQICSLRILHFVLLQFRLLLRCLEVRKICIGKMSGSQWHGKSCTWFLRISLEFTGELLRPSSEVISVKKENHSVTFPQGLLTIQTPCTWAVDCQFTRWQ